MHKISEIVRKLPPWSFTMVVFIIILYLTLVPRPLPPMKILLFPHADKVAHALMFGSVVIAMLTDYTRKGGCNILRFALVSVLVSISFGGLIELLQRSMEMGRSGDWYDLMADAGGALVCAGFAPIISRIFRKEK